MMRGALTLFSLVAVFIFPAPLAIAVALLSAVFSPLTPLAVGILADALYYTESAYVVPLYSLWGAVVALLAFFVRRFVATSIIER